MKSLLYLLISLTLLACKDDDNNTPTLTLPPATQTGANTFGCLIDGKVFIPDAGNCLGCVDVSASYQFVDGVYTMNISATKENNNEDFLIAIDTKAVSINENLYEFYTTNEEYIIGRYEIFQFPSSQFFKTENNGELKITNLDQENRIISGTFWFDAFDEAGNKTEIRDGRFDIEYTE